MDAGLGTSNVSVSSVGELSDVVLAKKGDKVAFERLVRKHSVSLYRVARGILKCESDIEDAAQETIIKAYKKLVSLRSDLYFKTWLIKILVNECNYILRANKKTVNLGELESASPNNQYENLELFSVVQSLDPDLRIVIFLFYYEGLPQKDIAEVLGLPVGTVSSRLSRSREKLRTLITEK
ncbi:sigma-70 family RNA polymerase sigma factor [Desulfosporosinus sp. OT]|uniref:RNA polymerase sigma factor n=1 Tax=Desulfosporosinus sp. OT TaxID=913865 RepID=UPI000223A7CF|nr:sigma-70 family RNA polymerase sigma factor [Desulfosporosinus sp. OT]EGW37725.1 RNA polymerase sigma factor, sigma-70 family protein [Desulfosporosinus sp. OT]